MYAALWHVLPGPVWIRILILIVLAAAALYALVTWAFPWADRLMTSQEGTVRT